MFTLLAENCITLNKVINVAARFVYGFRYYYYILFSEIVSVLPIFPLFDYFVHSRSVVILSAPDGLCLAAAAAAAVLSQQKLLLLIYFFFVRSFYFINMCISNATNCTPF